MSVLSALARDGLAIIPNLADAGQLAALAGAVDATIAGWGGDAGARARVRNGGAYAVRNLLDVPAVRDWATAGDVVRLLRSATGEADLRPVRGLSFDKTAEANWKVAWHQDRSIAVRERADVDGFGPWSSKAGVVHVQPPVEVLTRMVTVRLCLDDCAADNGPLRVVPGSHRHGILAPADVRRLPRERGEVTCVIPRGGALLMRPLLLHASSPAANPRRRRVIHVEYSPDALPAPLEWYAQPAGPRKAGATAT